MSTPQDDLEVDPHGAVMPFARRAPRIAQADVFRAADELLLEGHRPTIDRVRMRLGRGSPNTINDHLDDWWAKLGSRLRDLPGQEFPQLPERVAHTLQQLWNEALDGAQVAMQDGLTQREQVIVQQEETLRTRANELAERERANTARATALEESLSLVRQQLTAANQRSDRLEATLQTRDAEDGRLRARIEELECIVANLRTKHEAAGAAHQAERTRLEERHAAAEARWLTEVDRARQATKDATREHERQLRTLHDQVTALGSERDRLREQWVEARTELKAGAAVREQLEARLRSMPDMRAAPARTRSPSKRVRAAKKIAR